MPDLNDVAVLRSLSLDPGEPLARSRCPWCGEDVLLGVRLESRALCLVHTGHHDPTDPTRTRVVCGCPPFVEALGHDDVIRRLYTAGARFENMTVR